MTVSSRMAKAIAGGAGAPPALMLNWDQVNWERVNKEVMQLQVRIAKAVREGKWNKVKALQRLLTRSHNGK